MVLSTVFVIIVQFNLLIAIVNQIYSDVEDNKDTYKYYDLVDLIMENKFLTKKGYDDEKLSKGKHLVIVRELE